MSATVIEIPDSLRERLEHFSENAGIPVKTFVEKRLARILPEVPSDLPEGVRDELFALEKFSIDELSEEAERQLGPDEIPAKYTPGDVTDRLTLRKAYARALIDFLGESLDK